MTERYKDRYRDIQTEVQKDRWTGRQTDIWNDLLGGTSIILP